MFECPIVGVVPGVDRFKVVTLGRLWDKRSESARGALQLQVRLHRQVITGELPVLLEDVDGRAPGPHPG